MTTDEKAQGLRDAVIAATSNCEHGGFHKCYGLYPGGDPRRFTPDVDCCTPQEIEAHAVSCREWDNGEGTDRGPSCATRGDGSAWTGTGFGIGTYTFDCDDPLLDAALDALCAYYEQRGRVAALEELGCVVLDGDCAIVFGQGDRCYRCVRVERERQKLEEMTMTSDRTAP